VLLYSDLARLYNIGTRRLKEAVKRNLFWFPEDFIFELTKEEFNDRRSQFVTSDSYRMDLRYSPMVFTQHGVLMLSSILNSRKSLAVNIQIMRIFTKLRLMLADTLELRLEIEEVKKMLQTKYFSKSI